jgi:predicted transcriptional regulator
VTPAGTATPAAAEWPALRAAWQRGTVEARDLIAAGATQPNAAMLLSRMARRGLLCRHAHGHYEAAHTRETMISFLMGED